MFGIFIDTFPTNQNKTDICKQEYNVNTNKGKESISSLSYKKILQTKLTWLDK